MKEYSGRAANWLVLGAGAFYLLISWYSPALFRRAGVPLSNGTAYTDAQIAVFPFVYAAHLAIPASVLGGVILLNREHSEVRRAFDAEPRSRLIVVFAVAAIISWTLHATGVWPWISLTSPYGQVISGLRVTGRWDLLVLLLGSAGILVPIIEEVVFRHAVPRVLSPLLNRNSMVGLAVSASIFSLAHFGPSFLGAQLLSGVGISLFGFGLITGYVTSRREGRIRLAITIHIARNLSELVWVLAMS